MRKPWALLVSLLFVLLLCVTSGCASYKDLWSKQDNLKNAAINKPNLYGKTQQEIVASFGSPNETRTSYSGKTQFEYWTYKCLVHLPLEARYRHYVVSITFKNGVADDVSYEEETTY